MSGEVANYVIFGLVSVIAVIVVIIVLVLVYNRNKARLFKEYTEKSPLVDILKDQMAHGREDIGELQEEVERLTEQVSGLRNDILFHLVSASKESKIDIGRVENTLGQINNRLENYRFLLSKLEENSRK